MEFTTGSHINAGFRHGIESDLLKNPKGPVITGPLAVEVEAAGSVPHTVMADNPSSGSHHPKTRKRVFGLSHLHKAFTGHKFNPFDYKKKYEEDEYGKEWDPNARVWRVYLDEAQIFDLEMTEGWKDTLDVFLVFAGLFSAVVATFLGISVPALQPDYGQLTASLLMEVIELQRAVSLGHSPDSVSHSPTNIDNLPSSAQTGDRWVNALWFISLTLSLCTALIAVLSKQWIQQYTKFVSGTPLEQVRLRQFRYNGLEQWGVPVIIGLMPLLLHASLFLYLAGLVLFTLPLDETTGIVVCGITALALVAYFVSNFLPLVFVHCPYTTPVSIYAHDLVLGPFIRLLKLIASAAKGFSSNSSWLFLTRSRSHQEVAARRSLKSKENDAAAQNSDTLRVGAVMWLHSISSNPTVSEIALESISALPIWVPYSARDTLRDKLQHGLRISLGEKYIPEWGWSPEDLLHPPGRLIGETSMTTLERLARAMAKIADPMGIWYHGPAYRMLLRAGQAEGFYSPELVLLGNLTNSTYDEDPSLVSDTKQIEYQALLYDLRNADPSIWTSCIRCLIERTTRSMSQYTTNSYQTPPLLSLLNLIPTGMFDHFSVPWPRNDYLKWSALIRYMIACFYPPLPYSPGKDAQLCDFLIAYDEHEHIDLSSPEHRRLTELLLCYILIAFFKAELIPQEGIGELLEEGAYFRHVNSLLNPRTTGEPVKKRQTLVSGSPRSELAAVGRKLLHGAVQQFKEFSPRAASVLTTLFIALFKQREAALDDDVYLAWLQVMQSTKRDLAREEKTGWFMLPYEGHLELMEVLGRFIKTRADTRRLTDSTRALDNTPGRHSYEALFTQKNILSLYQVLASYNGICPDMMGVLTRKENLALKLYTQRLLQIFMSEGSKSKVNIAAFSALRELLYNSPGHEKVRFNGTHGSVYIHALMTKLQRLEPQRGGFDRVNEDGTLQFAVYQKVRVATKEELSSGGSLSLQDNQFIKELRPIDVFGEFEPNPDLEHWIIGPMNENVLAEISESSGDTGSGKASWWNPLHPWRKAHSLDPV